MEKENGKEQFAGPSMDNIIKSLAEAKQKEENFKKRQVGFVDRAIRIRVWIDDRGYRVQTREWC